MIIASTVNMTNVSGSPSATGISATVAMAITGSPSQPVISGSVSVTGISSTIGSSTEPLSSRYQWNKDPVEAEDGSETVFTLPSSHTYVSGSLRVYMDGLRQIKDSDYTESSTSTFTMTIAPAADETLSIDYLKV